MFYQKYIYLKDFSLLISKNDIRFSLSRRPYTVSRQSALSYYSPWLNLKRLL